MMDSEIINKFLIYYTSIKGSLFVTSVTIGAFLFTMKTFIIQTMKKEVYDTESYGEYFDSAKLTDSTLDRYKQLTNLRQFLFLSILFSLTSGILNVTLGYLDNFYIAAFCSIMSIVSWVFVLISLFLVNRNLSMMLLYSDVINESESRKSKPESKE